MKKFSLLLIFYFCQCTSYFLNQAKQERSIEVLDGEDKFWEIVLEMNLNKKKGILPQSFQKKITTNKKENFLFKDKKNWHEFFIFDDNLSLFILKSNRRQYIFFKDTFLFILSSFRKRVPTNTKRE